MANLSKGTVREAAAAVLSSGFSNRNRIDISSQAHVARAIHEATQFIEVYMYSNVYYFFDIATSKGDLTAVASDGGAGCTFTSASHGLSNGNIVVLRGFSDDNYNVMGTVANSTANTFDITPMTFGATDTGQWGQTSDTISTANNIILLANTPIVRRVPWALETDTGDIIVVHFKQVSSSASKYIRFVEL